MLVIFCSATLLARAGETNETPVDGYAAVVDDRIITVGDVMDFIQPTELDLQDAYEGEELAAKREEAYKTGRDLLVEQALILQEFKKQGANVPDRLVNDRINEFIFERFHNDRAKFLAALAEEQITLDEWRDRIRDRIIVGYLRRQEVIDKIEIAPGDILAAYEKNIAEFRDPAQVKLRMIVFKRGADDASADAREKAVRTRGRLLAGEYFADVAREVSEDAKADSGGDWGWMDPSTLRDELRAAAEKLPTGEVSDVIETPEAYYLMLVEDRKPARIKPLAEVRDEIASDLRRTEGERLYREWIDRLKKKHFVQIY